MNKSLLLFTLGPVQDFIAAGRRTSDLREGSFMLSCITSAALKAVVEQIEGGKDAVLFPNLDAEPELIERWKKDPAGSALGKNLPENLALPNRFLVKVPTADAARLAKDAEKAAREALRAAVASARAIFGNAFGWDEGEHFLEIAWGALPLDAEETYKDTYIALEQAVGGTKAIRAFSQVPSSGFRDSLAPAQGSLIPHAQAGQKETETFWRRKENRTRLRLREGEQLSALSLTKRLFSQYSGKTAASQFPSTASFAVADFKREVIQKLDQEPLRLALEAFLQAVTVVGGTSRDLMTSEDAMPLLKALAKESADPTLAKQLAHLPGDWLYAEYLTLESLSRETEATIPMLHIHDAQVALRNLLRQAEKVSIAPPSRYYAVIQYDGDHMGRWLSGEKLLDGWDKLSAEAHREVSMRLGTFARHLVRHLAHTQYLGQLVYSGGDDVLAFVSFNDALPLLESLRAAFSGHLEWRDGKYFVDFKRQSDTVTLPKGTEAKVIGPQATASAGLVLAHQQDPLTEVMALARKAEKAAKTAGRDRFCLNVGRRSGDSVSAVGTWTVGSERLLHHVQVLMKAFQENRISSSFLYDARETERMLPAAAVQDELKRLFKRRTEGLKPTEREALWQSILTPLNAYSKEADPQKPTPLQRTLDLLQVAVILGKGGDRSL